MADSVMIGAVPAANDPIHTVSSERVAHMTLLFFGPANGADMEAIRAAVAQTAQKFKPVTVKVLRRDTLGDDKADVLMLDPGDLRAVRSALLANSAVRAAFNAYTQYPQWTPHLTVGYPDTPATGEPGRTITFDRIALWTGDYEGPDFPLGAAPSPVLAAVVRTPAGAKKYGQPIGSVITPDVVSQVVKRAVRAVTVPAPHKGHVPTDDEVKAARSDIDANPDLFRGSGEEAVYLTAAGYNERPTVLSTEAFDAFKGKTVSNYAWGPEKLSTFWRGVRPTGSGVDPYTNLTSAKPSDFYVGFGVYSNGTHVGNEQAAAQFAHVAGHRIPKTSKRFDEGSSMIRIKIHPDARVVSYDKVPTMADPVEWAVEHGYDVIDLTPTGDSQAGVVVLNRSVMVVEEMLDPIPPKRVFAVGSRVEWGGGKRIQGEVLKDLGGVILVKPPWAAAPLRMNPEKLTQITEGSTDEVTGRVASAGAPGQPGLDVPAGGTDDPGLGAVTAGLPGEGRGGVPQALGTADRTHRPVTAAGDSWRWQLRDKNGKWIEMGSEVRYLVRGLYRQGIVIGSPSPGMADVHEHITELVRTIPSSRLEVVKSAASVVERTFKAGKVKTDLTDNPALVDLVERAQESGASLADWGEYLVPDEYKSIRETLKAIVPSTWSKYGSMDPIRQREAFGSEIWDLIKGPATELGFDEDTGPIYARGIGIKILERLERENMWTSSTEYHTGLASPLNDVRVEGRVAIATTVIPLLNMLENGDRYMTQFEVGESGGYYDPDLRAVHEAALFGLHPDVNVEKRPVYGYVFTPGMVDSTGVEQYGGIRLVLKDSVRDRATMTVGDSLGTGAIAPVPMNGPDVTDKEAYMASSAIANTMRTLAIDGPDVLQEYDYFEAQIQGGVTLADVEEIVILDDTVDVLDGELEDDEVEHIKDLASQYGIKVVRG